MTTESRINANIDNLTVSQARSSDGNEENNEDW